MISSKAVHQGGCKRPRGDAGAGDILFGFLQLPYHFQMPLRLYNDIND